MQVKQQITQKLGTLIHKYSSRANTCFRKMKHMWKCQRLFAAKRLETTYKSQKTCADTTLKQTINIFTALLKNKTLGPEMLILLLARTVNGANVFLIQWFRRY